MGTEIVVAAVIRRVGDIHAGTDHRGLVAHQVDTVQQRGQNVGVADVKTSTIARQRRIATVCGGQHGVHGDHVVTRGPQCCVDSRPDETGRAGQQHSHGWSNGN